MSVRRSHRLFQSICPSVSLWVSSVSLSRSQSLLYLSQSLLSLSVALGLFCISLSLFSLSQSLSVSPLYLSEFFLSLSVALSLSSVSLSLSVSSSVSLSVYLLFGWKHRSSWANAQLGEIVTHWSGRQFLLQRNWSRNCMHHLLQLVGTFFLRKSFTDLRDDHN
jgi:hypothetical protein